MNSVVNLLKNQSLTSRTTNMKTCTNQLLKGVSLLTLVSVLFFSGCTEEQMPGGGTLPPLAPFLQFLDESGAIVSDTTLEPGGVFRVKLDLQTGDNPLKSVDIREDGDLVPTTRLELNSGFTTPQNPYLITGSDVDGFELIIDIEAHDAEGVRTYTFRVEDEVGETDEISLDVEVMMEEVRTPIDTTTTMILVNNADGQLQGGLDLDVPETVSANSNMAELRDLGIDLDMPTSSNWIRQIQTRNGAMLVMLDTADVNFSEVSFKEEVKALYDNGTEENVTTVLSMDDVFVVKRDNDYFLLVVTEVVVTSDDNNDYYQFDIKSAFDVE
jgi:hypothetical protein